MRAPWALGQSIIAKNFFGVFRAIAKTNFPEILFPPPGGNQFPAKSENLALKCFSGLFSDGPGPVHYRQIFGGDFRDIVKTNFPGIPFLPAGGNGFGRGPKTKSQPF